MPRAKIFRPLIACGWLAMAFSGAGPAGATAVSPAAALPAVKFLPTSKIWLDGESNIHPYRSEATQWQVKATASMDPQRTGGPRLADLEVVIVVKGLKSGNGGLDDQMYKALKAERFPTIRFSPGKGTLGISATGQVDARSDGQLAVAGVIRPTVVQAVGSVKGANFHVTGRKELSMRDFGIVPPALLFGAITCSDRIVIHFDLLGKVENQPL